MLLKNISELLLVIYKSLQGVKGTKNIDFTVHTVNIDIQKNLPIILYNIWFFFSLSI